MNVSGRIIREFSLQAVEQLLMQTDYVMPAVVPPTSTRGMPLRTVFSHRGFTLVELAIVLFIVALLLGGMLLPLSAQQDIRARQDTDRVFDRDPGCPHWLCGQPQRGRYETVFALP